MLDVVVIGAGIAGLAAARALKESKKSVVVLEARSRIGGRIHTEHGFDYGAHWIHSTEGNPLTRLAQELGVPTRFVGGDSTYTGGWDRTELRSLNGVRLPITSQRRSILEGDDVRDRLDQWRMGRLATSGGDASVAIAVREALGRKRISQEALWHLRAWARDDCAADLEDLSALNHDTGQEVFGYGDSVLPGGYTGLTEGLRRDLEIETCRVVAAVEYGTTAREGVRIFTQDKPYDSSPLRARSAVITVPLGVLKAGDIRFDPPLPQDKVRAIEALGFGCLAKLAYLFDKSDVWWPKTQYTFARANSPTGRRENKLNLIVNAWASHGKPMLVVMVGGAAGRRLETMPERAARDWGWDRLKETLGPELRRAGVDQGRLLGFFRTDWSVDPFARGAYSFMKVNAQPGHIQSLAASVGDRLHFAGEATSPEHWANAHGAYLSGLVAASKICANSSVVPPRHFVENRHFRDIRIRAQRFFDLTSTRSPRKLDMEYLVEAMKSSPVLGGLDEANLRLLATLMTRHRRLPGGRSLCVAGEAADEMYLIVQGQVLVRVPEPGHAGSFRTLQPYQAGDIVGDFGFFSDGRRTADMMAGKHGADLYSLKYRIWERFLVAFPEVTLALYKKTGRHLAERLSLIRKRSSPSRSAV